MIVRLRVRWIIVLALLMALIGFGRQNVFLVRFALACLIWIGIEWAVFRARVDMYLQNVRAERELRNRQGPTRVLWESQSVGVLTRLRFPSAWLWLPPVRATFHDLLPVAATCENKVHGRQISLGQELDVILSYRIRSDSPGKVKFTGLRFVIEDLHGFFQAERFVSLPQDYRVLPLAIDSGTMSTIRKRRNVLPPPGDHLMPKPGVGSELMEIREYVPGDSPRSIAWKVSARRDELMCKEFESEVPVRCQLIVDMSRSIRLGYPGLCLGGRLVSLAALIASKLSSHRDPIGLSVFDGKQIDIWRASASRKSILRMIDGLSNAIDRPIEPVDIPPDALVRSAFDIARVRYPEASEHAQRRLKRLWPTRAAWKMRLRVAAVLCNHYRLDQIAMGELVDDDTQLAYWLQRFHSDHGAPYTGPLFDSDGNYLFDDRTKIDQLSKLIRRVAARGRDNELIVVMAELTDADYDLQSLVQAIKYAKARHHRVAILVAWPTQMPLPKQSISLDTVLKYGPNGATEWLLERRQKQQAFVRLRTEFGKLRVPVAAASDEMATNLILNQLEVLRSGRTTA